MEESSIKAYVGKIDTQKAQKLLQNVIYQRRINKKFVSYLSEQIKKGYWRVNGEPIIISEFGNLMDGSHRLLAVIEAQIPIETLIVEGIDECTYDTLGTGRSRTVKDLFSATGFKARSYVSGIIVKHYLLKGLRVMGYNAKLTRLPISTVGMSHAEVLKEYIENEAEYNSIDVFVANLFRKSPLLPRPFLFGVMAYLTKEKGYDSYKVIHFLRILLNGSEQPEYDEINSLNKRLISLKNKECEYDGQALQDGIFALWDKYNYKTNKINKL